MDINNLDTINSKVASYSAKLLPVIKNRTNKEIKFLYDFGFRSLIVSLIILFFEGPS